VRDEELDGPQDEKSHRLERLKVHARQ
jgi:hypothetical protein